VLAGKPAFKRMAVVSGPGRHVPRHHTGSGARSRAGKCETGRPPDPGRGALIVFAALTAYHNSLSGPFVLDDGLSIPENSTIRHLWPIWNVLPPRVAE
jgi:hypothetical protein